MKNVLNVLLVVIAVLLVPKSYCQTVATTSCQSSDAMYKAFNDAMWPAEAVKLGKAFQGCYPNNASPEMVSRIEKLQASEEVLRKTSLFREGFFAVDKGFLRLTALGDPDTALQAANSLPEGSRHIAWLQYAALLGNAAASKRLANHYSELGQANEAAKWLKLAIEHGAQMPTTLDNVRK